MAKALPKALEKTTKRLNIFLGALGSGKTTVALNVALQLAASGEESILVDLDVINPYFRSRMLQKEFASYGIKIICPPAEIARSDLPALPAAIRGALVSSGRVCMDVGGDSVGATVLGCYRPYLPEGEYRLFLVINARRPFTQDVAGITAAVKEIENAARLRINCFVNNTNLGSETGVGSIRKGLEIVRAAADHLGVFVAFSAVTEKLFESAKDVLTGEILTLKEFITPPWIL
ncbi:MAG: hypothetical protein AB1510_03670 [Bacillota bacterium]